MRVGDAEQAISWSVAPTGVSAKAFAGIGTAVGGAMTIRLPVGLPLTWNQSALDALGQQPDAQLAKVLNINPKPWPPSAAS